MADTADLTTIGWIELIDLPELGLTDLKAKIDTGARTSALHVDEAALFDRDGARWVRFDTLGVRHEAPLVEERDIRNTGGVAETRPVIRTKFRIGRRSWTIDLSLTDRAEMTFPLIVGRAALKNHRIAVHTRRTYLTRPKPDAKGTTT